MFNKELEIIRLKAQLEWYKGEVYATKTIQQILERIRELETGKPNLKILDIPV